MGRVARKTAKHVFDFSRAVFKEFNADQCTARAAGLAFATLITLVPLSALLFSLFSSLGSFTGLVESVQAFLVQLLVPTRQQEIIEYLNRFVENTQTLGVVGLLVFLATSILLMAAIHRTFDAVWGSATRRNSLLRLVTYASVLIVGSFVINMGLNLTGALRTLIGTAFAEVDFPSSFFFSAFPPIFVFFALTFMIKLVPSAKIATRSAMLGALVGALLWAVAQVIFVFWTTQVIRLSVIYGSLAVIPIFLIWLYVGWLIVLCSLEVTFTHQYKTHKRGATLEAKHAGPGLDLLIGIETYFAIAERFAAGSGAPTAEDIARRVNVPVRDLQRFIEALKESDLIVISGRRANRYVPARSLDKTSLSEVLRAVYGIKHLGLTGKDAGRTAVRLFLALTGAAESAIATTSVADYLNRKRFLVTDD